MEVDTVSGAFTKYVEREPAPDLAHLVTRIWQLQMPSPQRFERIVPLPFAHFIVNLSAPYQVLRHGKTRIGEVFAETFVSGLQTTYLVNENPPELHHIGVEFYPYGIESFSAFSAIELADRVLDGNTVFPGIGDLREAALIATPEVAMDMVEDELRRRLRPALEPHPAVVSAVRAIAQRPDCSITAVAEHSGVSHKTLIAQFRRHCGVTPKVFADVYRHFHFLGELPQEGPLPTWTELVARSSYYDQPHFIRVFTRFTGMTPRAYFANVRQYGLGHPSFVVSDDDFPEG